MPILPSNRQGVYLLEHCRVMVKDEKLTYVYDEGKYRKFWAIPYGNTSVLLLGTGTSITQAAARLLSEAGVMLGFVGGGGTPLFLASQDEYRPTEPMQRWADFWWDDAARLAVAKHFQRRRCEYIERTWARIEPVREAGADPDIPIRKFREALEEAGSVQNLLSAEAVFARGLYSVLSAALQVQEFVRDPGKKDPNDTFNAYLDHGNYLAYGLAASTLWVMGIPHSMPVVHGKTRRGALVFDVADIIKDGAILPNAFYAAAKGETDQQMRDRCTAFLDQSKALPYLFQVVEEGIGRGEAMRCS